MFTRQLSRAKRSALRLYRRRVMEQARLFESCGQMRVVPFDWRSVSQLVGSAFGSVASLLPALHLQGPMSAVFSSVQKLLLSLGQHSH
jgi:hypothetical protein